MVELESKFPVKANNVFPPTISTLCHLFVQITDLKKTFRIWVETGAGYIPAVEEPTRLSYVGSRITWVVDIKLVRYFKNKKKIVISILAIGGTENKNSKK